MREAHLELYSGAHYMGVCLSLHYPSHLLKSSCGVCYFVVILICIGQIWSPFDLLLLHDILWCGLSFGFGNAEQ